MGQKQTAGDKFAGSDLSGRVIIVTGGNTGIGFISAKHFAHLGAHVFIACRNAEKASDALKKIEESAPEGKEVKVEALPLDLNSLESVRAFVDKFKEKKLPLHVLLNNAGIMALPERQTTEDGFEKQIGVNHFGHFLLTILLLPILRESAPSRIINVSSAYHSKGTMVWEDIMSTKSYSDFVAYGRSKLANILFTKELDRRLAGVEITTYAVHPGWVTTELTRNMGAKGSIAQGLGKIFGKEPEQGALTQIRCAIAADLPSGKYWADEKEKEPLPTAKNMNDAYTLWNLSMELTKVSEEEAKAAVGENVDMAAPEGYKKPKIVLGDEPKADGEAEKAEGDEEGKGKEEDEAKDAEDEEVKPQLTKEGSIDALPPKAEEPEAEEKKEEPKVEKAEEPKAEEPKAEEPKVEKAEEPKAEEPKVEEPKAEEPKAEEPEVEEPKAEEPEVEEPKAEEPEVEEAKVEEEVKPQLTKEGSIDALPPKAEEEDAEEKKAEEEAKPAEEAEAPKAEEEAVEKPEEPEAEEATAETEAKDGEEEEAKPQLTKEGSIDALPAKTEEEAGEAAKPEEAEAPKAEEEAVEEPEAASDAADAAEEGAGED